MNVCCMKCYKVGFDAGSIDLSNILGYTEARSPRVGSQGLCRSAQGPTLYLTRLDRP